MPDKTGALDAALLLDVLSTHLLASLDPQADMAEMIKRQAVILDVAFNRLIVKSIDDQTGHSTDYPKLGAALRSQHHFLIALTALDLKNAATNKLNKQEASHAALDR